MKYKKKIINVFKPRFRSNEILNDLKKIFKSGWTGIGNKTVIFEKEWEKYSGLKNSLFLNSATAGLHVAVDVLKLANNWNSKTEIITTPISFVSTSHCILYAGLKPVFCDIDDTGTLDPKKILNLINKNTKAIIFVGLGGSMGNLNKISSICKRKNLKLILDGAHMSGSFDTRKKHVGQESDIAIFSFQAVKNLPTADAGIINFKNTSYYNLAKQLSWCGISKNTFEREFKKNIKLQTWEYDVPYLGYKYNGNSVMALIAKISLKYLDKDNDIRRKISKIYEKKLKKNKKIFIVPHSKGSSRHLFSILVENRKRLINYLKRHNINPGVHYKSILEFSFYKKNKFKSSRDMSVSKKFSNNIVSLPLHTFLELKDINKICKLINGIT